MEDVHIYSVSQLNSNVRQRLESEFTQIWLSGEISNFAAPASGHWYLTLKDENAQIRCAMFRVHNSRISIKPQNGMQVLVRAMVSLYEPRGDYQLIINSLQLFGDGILQQQFEALKTKLAAEGLFAENAKKTLPPFVNTIGIITSDTGAALQDILHVLQRRNPSLGVIIYPTAVQGKKAAMEMVTMLQIANQRNEVDALILARGGGSLEDLWCFNEEQVARAIFNSHIPIISAVGHETDVTIADFVADVRAPTPSAAAEIISKDKREIEKLLQYQQQRLEVAFDRLLGDKSQRLNQYFLRLTHQHPINRIHLQKQYLQQSKQRLQQATLRLTEHYCYQLNFLIENLHKTPFTHQIKQHKQYTERLIMQLNHALQKLFGAKKQNFLHLCDQLDGLSPLKLLARGYSVTQNQQGETISSIGQVKINNLIEVQLSDGRVTGKVIAVKN